MLLDKVNRDNGGSDFKCQELVLLCDKKFSMMNILRKEGEGIKLQKYRIFRTYTYMYLYTIRYLNENIPKN